MSAPEKEKRSLELQNGVLQDMQEEAIKTDRSLSYVVQAIWQATCEQIAGVSNLEDLASATAGEPGDLATQMVFLPVQMHQEIENKAKELSCSPGRLIEAAWILSRK